MPEPDNMHTWMRCAANEGNLPRVKELLKQGANVDSTNFVSIQKYQRWGFMYVTIAEVI